MSSNFEWTKPHDEKKKIGKGINHQKEFSSDCVEDDQQVFRKYQIGNARAGEIEKTQEETVMAFAENFNGMCCGNGELGLQHRNGKQGNSLVITDLIYGLSRK
jgi:hypothetical protein